MATKTSLLTSVFIRNLSPGNPNGSRPPPGISVQVFIALTIICSTLLLGGILIWKNYQGAQHIMVSAAGESAQQLGKTLNERARRMIEPPQNVIHLLSHDPITVATTLQQRLERLPALAESLNANQMLSAIYVGYANGEFVLIRELNTSEIKKDFSAPEDSDLLVQTVSQRADGTMEGAWRFYTSDLTLLRTDLKPEYRFDPRDRPWFTQASGQTDAIMIKPYVFFTTHQTGITLAKLAVNSGAVIGMDVAIDDLKGELADLHMTGGTEVAVVGGGGNVIAHPTMLQQELIKGGDAPRLPTVAELNAPSLLAVFDNPPRAGKPALYHVNGEQWYGMSAPLVSFADTGSNVLIAVPAAEMLVEARKALIEEITWVTLLAVLLSLVGWGLSRRISRPLQTLADQVRARSDFNFGAEINVPSRITEIRELNDVLSRMSRTIHNFQGIALALNHETQLDHMLTAVLTQLVGAFETDGGAIYLLDSTTGTLKLAACHQNDGYYPPTLLLDSNKAESLPASVANTLDKDSSYLCVELVDRNEDRLGILVLQLAPGQHYTGEQRQAFQRFVQELSGAATVAIETRQLIEAQQRLLDAIIKLLANAIDAKSPYTGGHCERVPELAELLMDQVVAADVGPFAHFDMSDAERYEFRIAAWLHDCGKITSPESVMDKATKLETQYNRIHEIRTRFEVLWRDASIAYWQGVANGGNEQELQQELTRRQAALQDEFQFVANANIGTEFMENADIHRLREIGTQRWWRHFDNRLGLANYETARLGNAVDTLPVEEMLLADRPEHLVPWTSRKPPVAKDDPANIWGFDMAIPTHAYNYGELHNLSIRRGTLTREERFKINEHIVQTIIMLNGLPLPEHLKRVPDIAGNHHEKMDGTGYPRRLSKNDMGVSERVMMIADIFEALTAADRPYKKPKTLSESISILTHMARSGHIDPDLFRLFLTSGVYLEYSRRFLYESQIDVVDIRHYLDLLDEKSQ